MNVYNQKCPTAEDIADKALSDLINSLTFVSESLAGLALKYRDIDDDHPNYMPPSVFAGLHNVVSDVQRAAEDNYAQFCACKQTSTGN